MGFDFEKLDSIALRGKEEEVLLYAVHKIDNF
jgi:hypothetical protein